MPLWRALGLGSNASIINDMAVRNATKDVLGNGVGWGGELLLGLVFFCSVCGGYLLLTSGPGAGER